MIYIRAQATPSGGGSLNTIFDMTVHNTGVSPDAGSERSKIGNYDVVFRLQERGAITKAKVVRVEGFPRRESDAADLLLVALYGALGKERCDALIKKMKKGIGNATTKRAPKKTEGKIVYGRGKRSK